MSQMCQKQLFCRRNGLPRFVLSGPTQGGVELHIFRQALECVATAIIEA